MAEWWTYSLADFLLFSPRTYYRLIELYNRDIWPAQLLVLAAGLALLFLIESRTPLQGRLITAILALSWLWVAWAFHYQRYATINWAASYVAIVFAIEAVALLWWGVIRGQLTYARSSDVQNSAGLLLFLFAWAAYPIVGVLAGRSFSQAELFAVTPDPTAVGTLGLLLLARGRHRFALMIVPFLWCVIAALTLQAMQSPDAWLLPLLMLVALVGVVSGRIRSLRG